MTGAPPDLRTSPRPSWLGYDCRRRFVIGDWLAPSPARIRCNATRCNLDDAPGRYERWAFNDSGFFDTPALAAREWTDSSQDDSEPLLTYAFAMYPALFSTSGVTTVSVDTVVGATLAKVESPITHGFVFLGYDVLAVHAFASVQPQGHQTAVAWSCSPLFCNLMAAEIQTNIYALIGNWNDAVSAAERFGKEEPEPGPYVIIGVWADAPPPIPL
ncbi:MAG: hypothetical protein IV100_08505 [Myxococcales bacterium]|nr:hypothetical protein [Myxococcales bacterium]